jgi:tetratricopeptide (TPR) repeat protein
MGTASRRSRRLAVFVLLSFASSAAAQQGERRGIVDFRGMMVGSTINNIVGVSPEELAELRKAVAVAAGWTEAQERLMKHLEGVLALNEPQLKKALEQIDAADVPPELYPQKLAEFAETHKRLKQEMERITARYPNLVSTRAKALQLVETGEFDAARDVIQETQKNMLEVRREAAEMTALQALTASIQFRHREAASLYQAAAILTEADPATSVRYALEQVGQLLHDAGEYSRRDQAADAIQVLEKIKAGPVVRESRQVLDEVDHLLSTTLAFHWQLTGDETTMKRAEAVLNGIVGRSAEGSDRWFDALDSLGGLYFLAGEERYEEVVAIYRRILAHPEAAKRDALKQHLPRNFGSALTALGFKNEDAALIREGVKYCQQAVTEAAKESRKTIALLKYNLAIGWFRLWNVAKDPEDLKRSIAEFREVLPLQDRETNAISWAHTQTNLGIALLEQGQAGRSADGLHSAMRAFNEALNVWNPLEPRHRWFDTKSYVVQALKALAGIERRRKPLDDAKTLVAETMKSIDEDNHPDWMVEAHQQLGDVYYALAKDWGDRSARNEARKEYDRAFTLEMGMMLGGSAGFEQVNARKTENDRKLKELAAGRQSPAKPRRR